MDFGERIGRISEQAEAGFGLVRNGGIGISGQILRKILVKLKVINFFLERSIVLQIFVFESKIFKRRF